MSDISATLKALQESKRPFLPIKIEGMNETYYARKASYGEKTEIETAFAKAYSESRDKLSEDPSTLALFKREIEKQTSENIAKYITRADENDFIQEAMMILDTPKKTPKVEQKAQELMERRAAELVNERDRQDLVEEAIERRQHSMAVEEATKAVFKLVLMYQTYGPDKERVFLSESDFDTLPEDAIAEINRKVGQALKEAENNHKDSPLKPADSKQSDAHTP